MTTVTPSPAPVPVTLSPDDIVKVLAKRSFATVATTSDRHPHAAGVLYALVGSTMYVSTRRDSRKARNVIAHPEVAVAVPVRRVPFGVPPSTVQYQATAEVLALDDPHITDLVTRGRLKAITSHGELDDPDNCFLRITPLGPVHAYGIGMSLWRLARKPLEAFGATHFGEVPAAGRVTAAG